MESYSKFDLQPLSYSLTVTLSFLSVFVLNCGIWRTKQEMTLIFRFCFCTNILISVDATYCTSSKLTRLERPLNQCRAENHKIILFTYSKGLPILPIFFHPFTWNTYRQWQAWEKYQKLHQKFEPRSLPDNFISTVYLVLRQFVLIFWLFVLNLFHSPIEMANVKKKRLFLKKNRFYHRSIS